MRKTRSLRVLGFVGALTASAALVATTAATTGAYFSDSHDATLHATSGHLKLDVPNSDLSLDFTGLLPAVTPSDYRTKRINYTADVTTGSEDVWLVFPDDGTAEAFVGTAGDTAGGGLGRYGHFALSSTGGAHFTSYNLNNEGSASPHLGPVCSITSNGWGGSNVQATDQSDTSVPYCAPANAILLQSGLANGNSGYVDLTFGYTKIMTDQTPQQNQTVDFKIVATQHGVRPDDQNVSLQP